MREFYPNIGEIYPESIESWQVSNADLPDIPELSINPETYGGFVSEGFYQEMPEDGSETIGSDDFTHCSGLVVFEPASQKVIIAHFWPEDSGTLMMQKERLAYNLLDSMDPNIPKDMVLIQGERSTRQSLIEDSLYSGNFGVKSLRRVLVNSGQDLSKPWGFVFYKPEGKVKVFTRGEPATISTFSLFPELKEAVEFKTMSALERNQSHISNYPHQAFDKLLGQV